MNLIKFEDTTFVSEENKYLVKDFRQIELDKIFPIIEDMLNRIKIIDPEYSGSIEMETVSPKYLNLNTSYYDKFILKQKYKDYSNEVKFIAPKLISGNYFILNNLTYVPLIFLEKAPIDRIYQPEKKKNKIFANINPLYNFTFDFVEKKVTFKTKSIDLDIFLRIFFQHDLEYLKILHELKYIKLNEKNLYSREEFRKFIKFIGFHNIDLFEEKEDKNELISFLDNILLLEYFKDMFNDFYEVNNITDIFKKIIDINENNIEINMADLKNRRVVIMEYLFRPVFEIYSRLLYGIIDKNNTNFLPTINELSIITTGFHKNLHRGSLFDHSTPFTLPLINKVSQDINIINNGRLPKSWTENNPSSKGKICPISVSAADTALNLIFTSTTKINKFGRIL